MGKFDGILICTDLDGTLYRDDKTISKENKEAIEYFKREGGWFTFITGRMPYYSRQAYDAARPNVPFGCINGGGLYDGVAGDYVWKTPLADEVDELLECVDRQCPDAGIQVTLFDKALFSRDNEVTEMFRQRTGVPHQVKHYRDIRETKAKIVFGCPREDVILGVEKTLKTHPMAEKFSFIRSEKTLFEILPKGVDKGLALAKLIEYLGADPKKTIAVGDYNNDIGMFRAARYGIAVANACQAAKDAADLITVSNEQHAIAQIIYDIENGNIDFD